ncbi:TetR/AcrR family transcriptional regulator [Dactylosporangium sp. NPDC051484]|uniref:TetR/AcrR family transcriptional regulator n=1 Tax=Dactylosporangium sp. NPDC051484 TaxID=3154942 RepID=UPI00344F3D72
MGNREKLLDGAQQCLLEKGYAATTARDIAAAAGVSLAAINYHFRTTEALLDEALRRALDQWSDELERALTGGAGSPTPADPEERFVAIWDRVIASVTANRSLWTTQFELVTKLGRQAAPESPWAAAQVEAEAALAALFHGIDSAAEPELARAVGGLYQALLAGVVVQHLVAPERAMSGRDLALALRAVCERLVASGSSAVVQKV